MAGPDIAPDVSAQRSPAPWGVEGLATTLAVLALVAATAGVVVFVNQLTQPKGTVPVVLTDPEAPARAVPLAPLAEGAWIEPSSVQEVDLTVFDLPMGLRGLTEASALVHGLLLAAVALVLRRVLGDIAAGHPFSAAMPRRMGMLAGLALGLGLLPDVLDTIAATAVLSYSNLAGESSPVVAIFQGLPLDALLVAALLGVLMQVFRHGRWLTGEVEGLV